MVVRPPQGQTCPHTENWLVMLQAGEYRVPMDALQIWPQDDGQPVSCHEKLRVLEENWQDVRQVLTDAFEDAVLMGVSEQVMRDRLQQLVAGLQTPKVGA